MFDAANYPDLLVGLGSPDDAAVWRISDDRALVVTTDFFTPVVDDAYTYGAIAAANALSDLYAMGAQPFMALNVAAMPPQLPAELIGEILRGGAEKVREAGAVLAGGHTIQDKEPKYGLVAMGMVAIDQIMTKGSARPGDVLYLTKPLGFGVTTTAIKGQQAEAKDIVDVVDWMLRLNVQASRLAIEHGVRAATDVTGFSLLGHGVEMAEASGVALSISLPAVPFLVGASRYAERWLFPGGTADNRLFFGDRVRFDGGINEDYQMLLFDAQTSGGLLLSVPRQAAGSFQERAGDTGLAVWAIGEVLEGQGIEVLSGPLACDLPQPIDVGARVAYWSGAG